MRFLCFVHLLKRCDYVFFTTLFLFIFVPAFPLARVAGAAALGELEIPHGQQQFEIVLLAPHKDGTKQNRRCSHFTWALDDRWVAFPWV